MNKCPFSDPKREDTLESTSKTSCSSAYFCISYCYSYSYSYFNIICCWSLCSALWHSVIPCRLPCSQGKVIQYPNRTAPAEFPLWIRNTTRGLWFKKQKAEVQNRLFAASELLAVISMRMLRYIWSELWKLIKRKLMELHCATQATGVWATLTSDAYSHSIPKSGCRSTGYSAWMRRRSFRGRKKVI